MRYAFLLLPLLLLSPSAFAGVPTGGLSCKAHRASSVQKLKALMLNRLIYQNYYNDHGGFRYEAKTGVLTLRTKSGLATFCASAEGELRTEVICAPWGEAARVLYRQAGKKSGAGVALLQVLDESLVSIGDILLDCQQF